MNLSEHVDPKQFSILVCDDEESIRGLLAEALQGWGFQVKTAPNGEVAYEHLKKGELPHIILTDIRMGGMTGVELAAKAKELSQEIEIVIMTSHGSLETAVQAMRLGVYDYLTKPFENIEDVRRVLMHVCERIYLKFYSEFLMVEVKRKKDEIEGLANLSTELAKHLNPVKVIEHSCSALSAALDNSPVCYLQYVSDKRLLVATLRHPAELFAKVQPTWPLPDMGGNAAEQVKDFVNNLESNPEFVEFMAQSNLLSRAPADEKITWYLEPALTHGALRGVFVCAVKDWQDTRHRELFHRYVQSISTFYENALLHTQVLESSIRDGMTGLYNVRYFRERLKGELDLCRRYQMPLSVLFMDVDHFKKYNDTNGHPAGDEVLKLVATLLKRTFRSTEVIARYGGEEFVVMMHRCLMSDALKKAEAFRKLLEETPFPNEHTQPLGKVTISIGVAEFPGCGLDSEALLKAADDALYESKKTARNMVSQGRPPEGYVSPFVPKIVNTVLPPGKA